MKRVGKAGIAVLIVLVGGCAHVRDNLRTVEPDRFYRSGQMPQNTLENVIERYGIQTVINLRGATPDEEWYRQELAACDMLGVVHHDLDWSKRKLPTPSSLTQFVEWCRESPKPLLVHCQGGVHRSAIGAASSLLARGADVEEARRQLGPFFGDAPIGRLLDLYAAAGATDFDTWLHDIYPAQYAEATASQGAKH